MSPGEADLAASWQARRASGLEVLAVNLTDRERLRDVEANDEAGLRGPGPDGARGDLAS